MSALDSLKEGLSESQGIFHWIVATALITLATTGLETLHANSTTAGMVFLAILVWVATQAGIRMSLYVAALCAISFAVLWLFAAAAASAQQLDEHCTISVLNRNVRVRPDGRKSCR